MGKRKYMNQTNTLYLCLRSLIVSGLPLAFYKWDPRRLPSVKHAFPPTEFPDAPVADELAQQCGRTLSMAAIISMYIAVDRAVDPSR